MADFDEQIKSVCIVRNAETNFLNSCASIRGSLQNCSFPVPNHAWTVKTDAGFSVSYVLFPGSKDSSGDYENGTLEDLCLMSLKDPSVEEKLVNIDSFLGECEKNFNLSYPRLHKTRLHEYLVMHDKYVDSKIGEAARAGAFNFEYEVIANIKSIFEKLLGAQ